MAVKNSSNISSIGGDLFLRISRRKEIRCISSCPNLMELGDWWLRWPVYLIVNMLHSCNVLLIKN